MSKPTVAYASYCCAKDRARAEANYIHHMESHGFPFNEVFQVFQRCEAFPLDPRFKGIEIREQDYPLIMASIGVPFPDPIMDELTHGWSAPHYYAHHIVNLVKSAQVATSDYIVLADGDCFVKDQPDGVSWVAEGIRILESDPSVFVVSPSDGRPHGEKDRMMSQQMILVNRKRFAEMEFIPWDGKFIDGGPFQEFYALAEGFIYRYMVKNNLYRYLLPPQWRWWHKEWH
jgi:hypothetical protein